MSCTFLEAFLVIDITSLTLVLSCMCVSLGYWASLMITTILATWGLKINSQFHGKLWTLKRLLIAIATRIWQDANIFGQYLYDLGSEPKFIMMYIFVLILLRVYCRFNMFISNMRRLGIFHCNWTFLLNIYSDAYIWIFIWYRLWEVSFFSLCLLKDEVCFLMIDSWKRRKYHK